LFGFLKAETVDYDPGDFLRREEAVENISVGSRLNSHLMLYRG
jgi:hypothetical protein